MGIELRDQASVRPNILRKSRARAWLLAACLLWVAPPSAAQPSGHGRDRGGGAAAEKAAKPMAPMPEDETSTTQHAVRIGDETLRFTAHAGTYVLKEEDGTPKASFFYMAYLKDGVEDPATRPVLFSFNGGPGSSSVWLHLGLFGPWRVEMSEEGWALDPPYRLVPNDSTFLDQVDLVFIDPVTTGYSRAVPGEDDGQFHGVREDIEAVGEFIRLWVTRNERWGSPKILAGESYGTTRASGLANYLQERHGMYLNAVVLVSSILNFQTARFDVGNDLPYPLFLPTYTATAWYHGQLEGELASDLEATLKQAEAFALGDYASALMRGDTLKPEERRRIAEGVARFTGLSVDFVERSNLRVPIFRFVKELLRDEGRSVGRLDSRFQGMDRDSAGERYDYDPSMSAIRGPYSSTLNDLVRRELEFETDLPYEILSGRVQPWSYNDFQNRYVNVAEMLREAMTRNPSLKVFVASGYYDLATPYFATDYTVNHLGLDASLRKNVEIEYYESGHMMYIHLPSLDKLHRELSEFLERAVAP